MLKDFDSILVEKDATVKEAMRQLDKTAEKILFVVDEDDRLIGSLTDGDIRRWILADGTFNESVSRVCFKGTYCVNRNYDVESIKGEILKRRIVYVPVLDDQKRIVEFLIWDKLFDGELKRKSKERLNVPVVIMAGGKGARLDPFTRILPKPLVPIGEKTIIELIIEKFIQYDVTHFHVSVNHKSKIIRSYFEELNPAYDITYIYEDKPLGTAGALKQLDGQVEGELFLTNCDIIIDADYPDILRHHISSGNEITAVASMKNFKIPYGICEIKNGGTLVNIAEKPEFSHLVNTGMYVMNASILKYIPTNEAFDATDLIERAINLGRKVGVYPVSEDSWIDIGEWSEYRQAVERLKL